MSVSSAGFEPAFSGLKGRRPLRRHHEDNHPSSVSGRSRTCTANAGGLQPLGLANALADTSSTLGGIRTHDLHLERVATTPGWSARAFGECPAGVEPACPAWKADAWAARPRAQQSVGPEGLELSPHWLRARDAAANTWIPSFVPAPPTKKARGRGTPGLGTFALKDRVSQPQRVNGQHRPLCRKRLAIPMADARTHRRPSAVQISLRPSADID
jgi:hypothetical protein